jgi:hypothetical protein
MARQLTLSAATSVYDVGASTCRQNLVSVHFVPFFERGIVASLFTQRWAVIHISKFHPCRGFLNTFISSTPQGGIFINHAVGQYRSEQREQDMAEDVGLCDSR